MTVIDQPHLLIVDSGLPCDTFNVICRARLAPSDAPERARAAVNYFRQAQRPFSWWRGPADRPTNLHDVLRAVGLEPAETELTMVADLSDLRGGEIVQPPEFRIERVRSERALQAFAAICAANWTPPDPQVIRFYDLVSSALLSTDAPQWLYLGYLGDVPVGTAELTMAGGVAGLYNICTLAAHRRRGVGTALTRQPLLDARERGCRAAVLEAARAGVSLYERVGFRPFGEVTEYRPGMQSNES